MAATASSTKVVDYFTYSHDHIPDVIISQCVELFSSQYGVWSRFETNAAKLAEWKLKPGMAVKMSIKRLKETLLFDPLRCGVVVAKFCDQVIGHAFYTTFSSDNRIIRWITQLVVKEEWRRQGIASGLINNAIPDRSKLFAVGLASSHPAAIRALESAVRSRCSRYGNIKYAATIMRDNPQIRLSR